jgi:hypothetical protein
MANGPDAGGGLRVEEGDADGDADAARGAAPKAADAGGDADDVEELDADGPDDTLAALTLEPGPELEAAAPRMGRGVGPGAASSGDSPTADASS